MSDLVSVIVPIYNVEQYLERCIKSIQNQTYRNLEILLVDDGSPDRCGEICDRYAAEDERIKVIHKENGGLSDARNYGIAEAKGEYLLLVNSDDWIHTQMVELLISLIKKNSARISICGYQYAYEGKEYQDELIDIKKCVENSFTILEDETQKKYFEDPDKRIYYTVAWNKLYHRSVFEGIEYPKGKVHEDEYTTFKLLHKAEIIQMSEQILYYYFVRKNSIMGEFKESRFDAIGAYLEKLDCYVAWNKPELAGKMFIHTIRMLAQYQKWMMEADVDFYDKIQMCRKILVEKNKKYKHKIKINKFEKFELILFNFNFRLYYLIWNLKKR